MHMRKNPENRPKEPTREELEYAYRDLLALSDEARNRLTAVDLRLVECSEKILEEEKRREHAKQELEILEKEEDKITGEIGWRGYADKLKDYQDDVHGIGLSEKLLAEQVALQKEQINIKKEIKGYEKKISDIQWEIDARENR